MHCRGEWHTPALANGLKVITPTGNIVTNAGAGT
jgi:hypothetical protein